jgi:hypothetical protein
MTDRSKTIFLLVTVVGSFVVYSVIYYAQVFREAPYNFNEFKSFSIRYGTRDNMVNYYNSATGEYDYLNKHDSLIRTHLSLTKADLDTLHTDAGRLGFWDFPENELNADTTLPGYKKAPRYIVEFNYKRRTKKVQFDADFNGDLRLVDANKIMIKDIETVLNEVHDRKFE